MAKKSIFVLTAFDLDDTEARVLGAFESHDSAFAEMKKQFNEVLEPLNEFEPEIDETEDSMDVTVDNDATDYVYVCLKISEVELQK